LANLKQAESDLSEKSDRKEAVNVEKTDSSDDCKDSFVQNQILYNSSKETSNGAETEWKTEDESSESEYTDASVASRSGDSQQRKYSKSSKG